MMKNIGFLFLILIFAACTREDDFQNPSFIRIEGFSVVPPATNAVTLEPGYYTSDISSCIVFAHFAGRTTVDTIGHFELPFATPVLYSGLIDSLEIYPAVRISGISGMQPWYDFYKPAVVRNVTLTPGDTLDLGTLTTTYLPYTVDRHHDLFEPYYTSISFDSVTWHQHSPDEACSGEGYISVFVPDSVSNKAFYLNHIFDTVLPARSTLYLELDTRSDILYEIYMHSSYTYGGSTDQQPVMRVYPSDHWQHLYILLGRTWSWFNYNPTFSLSFAALNTEGVSGTIRLDNVKIISHP